MLHALKLNALSSSSKPRGFGRVLSRGLLLSAAGTFVFVAMIMTIRLSTSMDGQLRSGGTNRAVGPAPICGHSGDTLVRVPPNWTTFTPPDAGTTYVDPVFGCTLKRLTNSSLEETLPDGTHPSLMNYYSTFSPINATDTMLLVFSNNGAWRLKDTDGKTVVPAANMPPMNNGHPIWDAADGRVLYYTFQNALYSGTVSGNSVRGEALHIFGEYRGIVSPDAADLSQDGDHIALVGQNPNSTMDIFVWSLRRQEKSSVYTTACTLAGDITATVQPGCVHKLQLTGNNLLSIEFAANGSGTEQGLRLWNGSELVPLQNQTSHYDTGYDLSGNSIYVSMGNSWSLNGISSPCPSGWGLDVRLLEELHSAQCLLDQQPSWHISYRGSVSQPWIAISFFDTRPSGPEFYGINKHFQAPSATNWQLYEDEIILARIDANNNHGLIYRLAHARSRSVEGYWSQPHAAISRDGKYVIFTSNMANPNGCPASMYVGNECSDVYLIRVQ